MGQNFWKNMAHKKAGGSTSLGRDSQAKRLGVKKYGGQKVIKGNIIIRQRGTRYRAGIGTKMGKDQTIFAVCDGIVNFRKRKVTTFTSVLKSRQIVSVINKSPKTLK